VNELSDNADKQDEYGQKGHQATDDHADAKGDAEEHGTEFMAFGFELNPVEGILQLHTVLPPLMALTAGRLFRGATASKRSASPV
jgi:hypothetical protein